jgi:tetratricopeptide (TPR) repeat protein
MVLALVHLGNAYFERKEFDLAIEYYSRAAYLQTDDSTIFYNLAAAFSNSGFYQQAIEAYQKAVEIEPQMGLAHNGLAFAYYQLKKYEQAAQHLQIAEKLGFEVSNELKTAIQDRLN